MGIPGFLLRKLYKRGSLRETPDGHFEFRLHNPLANATLTSPPTFVINGVHYDAAAIEAPGLKLAEITPENPLVFAKGDDILLKLPGRLLRGGNRIHMTVDTKEFEEIDILVEDREALFCDINDPQE